MITSLMVFHAVISVFLILMVLLQFGKGAEAGLMSGVGDSSFIGAGKGNILSKITTVLAVLYLANSVYLARLQSHRTDSSILDSKTPIAKSIEVKDVKKTPVPIKAEEKKETK